MFQKMDKPILIDALHIAMGGGRGLLDYLVSSLIQRQVPLHLLRDERCSPLKEENIVGRVFVMEDNGNARKKFYKLHRNDYSAVFCFGNIPSRHLVQNIGIQGVHAGILAKFNGKKLKIPYNPVTFHEVDFDYSNPAFICMS